MTDPSATTGAPLPNPLRQSATKPLRIVRYPDPILKRKAQPVERVTDDLRALAARMLELMHEARGVGLAAPQVGVSIRLFVYNLTEERTHDRICLNPEIRAFTGVEVHEEGCLSLPGVTVSIRRATGIVMRSMDLDGRVEDLEGSELMARVWQHEIDHLDGRLIIDHMSTTDEIANRRALKSLRDEYRTGKK